MAAINTRLALVLPCLAVALSGCATIMHGTTQEIPILSAPAGAEVSVDGASVGRTPLSIRLQRKQAHQVRIEAAGYQPYQATVDRHVSGWAWGNAFLSVGALVGVPVDLSTGALYNLDPDGIRASLASNWDTLSPRDRSADARAAAGVRVASRLERAVMVGSRVRVSGSGGGSVVDGIVTAVRGDTLELTTVRGQVPLVLPLDHVERLELGVGRKGHGGTGAAVGLVAGGALGWALASSAYRPCEPSGWFSCFLSPESRGQAGAYGAVGGAASGAVVGLLIGAVLTTERWERVPLDAVRLDLAPLPAGRLGLGVSISF